MSNNKIVIEEVFINKNRIDYHYTVTGEWLKCFNLDEEFFIEYSIDISTVPVSIAIIPLLANILPMAWVCDAEIVIPVCDKAFYNSIEGFKKGYREMYPITNFAGNLIAAKLEDNHPGKSGGAASFFSGGVDAFDTLVCHADEHPILITLWGADVKFEDLKGWNNVVKHLATTSEEFDVDFVVVKSCFRRYLNEKEMNRRIVKDNWWHGYQHGIGMICHAAPITYVLKKDTIYFASSYTSADKGKMTCASDPTIDNFVRFGDSHIVHDGYEHTRQIKLDNITQFSKNRGKQIQLRVCWEAEGGTNCCQCEKCWRTLLGIYAMGEDPKKYGFGYDNFSEVCKLVQKNQYLLKHNRFYFYSEIQQYLCNNYNYDTVESSLRWFYDIEIDKLGNECIFRRIVRRVKKNVKVIINDILNLNNGKP